MWRRPGSAWAAFRLARHTPGLVDRAVAARLNRLVDTRAFDGAGVAVGMRERLGASGAEGAGAADA